MRLGSRSFWLGVGVGFFGGVLVLLALLSVALIGVTSSGGRAGQSIDHEPISLERAFQLIDGGQVYMIAIRGRQGNVDELCYFLLNAGGDFCRWKVDGVDVHVFTESMPSGVPILSDDEDKVGLTSEQLDDLHRRINQYNATASSLIEVLDQRE